MNTLSAEETLLLAFLRTSSQRGEGMPSHETIAEGTGIYDVSTVVEQLISKGRLRWDEMCELRMLTEKEEMLLDFCLEQFPEGRLMGNYWICGPTPRTSLHFILSGPSTGVYDPVTGKFATLSDDLEWSMVPTSTVPEPAASREAA